MTPGQKSVIQSQFEFARTLVKVCRVNDETRLRVKSVPLLKRSEGILVHRQIPKDHRLVMLLLRSDIVVGECPCEQEAVQDRDSNH